jgi:hypothetical protein
MSCLPFFTEAVIFSSVRFSMTGVATSASGQTARSSATKLLLSVLYAAFISWFQNGINFILSSVIFLQHTFSDSLQ